MVENQVNAKKYLVSKYDDYYNKLSKASKIILEYQGGKMTAEEMEIFEKDPNFDDIIKIRYLMIMVNLQVLIIYPILVSLLL